MSCEDVISSEDEFIDDSDLEEDELIVDSDLEEDEIIDDSDFEIDVDPFQVVKENVETVKAYAPDMNIDFTSQKITFQINKICIPKSLSVVCGYESTSSESEICAVEISCNCPFSWKELPQYSVYRKNEPIFVGKTLITNVIRSFFSPSYTPSEYYFSQCRVLGGSSIPNPRIANLLIAEGYPKKIVEKALSLFDNNLEKSRDFIDDKILPDPVPIPVSYKECPLLYLIFEIVETLNNIPNLCVICGKHIPVAGIKPNVCQNPVCSFAFQSLGVSANISSEIKRDPEAVDFLISMASCAFGTKFLDPKPPFSDGNINTFFETLPPIRNLANIPNDSILREELGPVNFEILRFFILANRAHLMSLNGKLKMRECKDNAKQFLMLMLTPERERIHSQLKRKHGVMFLWHGSTPERWYRILHTGLIDLGRTVDRQHAGPIYGDGIYLSNELSYSYSYAAYTNAANGNNIYRNSTLPKQPIVVALTENAKTSGLKKAIVNEYTQKDENSCAIRCIMVLLNSFNWDTVVKPPSHIPNVEEALSYITSK